MKIPRAVKSGCVVVLVTVVAALVSYLMLRWFHNSWETGVPVLDNLSLMVSSASKIGAQITPIFTPKWVVPLIVVVLLAVGIAGVVINRSGWTILIIVSFCALGIAHLSHVAGKFTMSYIAVGAGLLPLIVHAVLLRRQATARPDISQPRDAIFLVIVVLVAIVFRFHHLDIKPAGIINEAAGNAYQMRHYVTGEMDLWHDHWSNPKPLSWNGNAGVAVCVLFFKLFSLTPLTYKFVPAFSGVLSVVALFFMTRFLFGGRAAFLASFFLATSPWHTFFCRANVPQLSMAIVQSILTYYVLFYAFKLRSYVLFALLGVLTGISVYVYAPAKITCVGAAILTAMLLTRALIRDHGLANIARHATFMLICCATLAVTVIPYVKWGQRDPSYYYSTGGRINLEKAPWENEDEDINLAMHMLDSLKHVTPVLVHNRQLRTVGSDPYSSGSDPYSSQSKKGGIDPTLAMFFVLGLLWSVANIRKRECAFVLLWGAIGILPAILTEPMPKRLALFVPVMFLLAGLGAERLWFALEQSGPKIMKRYVLALLVGVLALGFICYGAHEYFAVTSYSKTGHPDFVNNRTQLYKAATQSDMFTDIDHSIIKLVMANHEPYSYIKDLSKARLDLLDHARHSGRPVSVVGYTKTNKVLTDELRALTVDNEFTMTEDFTIITLGRKGLDDLFKFSPARRVQDEVTGGEYKHVYRGSLIIVQPGKFEITFSKPVPHAVILDGKRYTLTLDSKGGATLQEWMSAGAHLIAVYTHSLDHPPILSSRRIDRSAKVQPFISGEHVHDIAGFRPSTASKTTLQWPLVSMVTLKGRSRLYDPITLTPGDDGLIYVTDKGNFRLHSFGHDGSMKMALKPYAPQKKFTLMRSMVAPDDTIYVAKPFTPKGIAKYDRTGKLVSEYLVSAMDMRLKPGGGFYAQRDQYIRMFSPTQNGELKQTKRFSSSSRNPPPHLYGMTVGADDTIYVLSADADLYVLDGELRQVATIPIGQAAVNSESRMAVDDVGRFYITDYYNDLVRIFDPGGNMLFGRQDINSPIYVKAPRDVAMRNGQLIVLSEESHNEFRFYTYEPPR